MGSRLALFPVSPGPISQIATALVETVTGFLAGLRRDQEPNRHADKDAKEESG